MHKPGLGLKYTECHTTRGHLLLHRLVPTQSSEGVDQERLQLAPQPGRVCITLYLKPATAEAAVTSIDISMADKKDA